MNRDEYDATGGKFHFGKDDSTPKSEFELLRRDV